ncbi:MAG: 3'-5' exonuclease [Chitinophagaceae bacterium]
MSPYPLHNILFVDIETVPQHPDYDELGTEWKELWSKKAEILLRNREDETIESIYNRAGIYAEFGKIICISCGVIQGTGNERKLLLKSFAGDSEQVLLHDFSEMLRKWAGNETKYLCAHNGKEFDFPYMCRRMIINGLPIPTILNSSGKKPWEVNFLDTMDLWKFGDFKNYTSLSLLATALSIPTPKDDIDGSMVGEVYWKERNIDRIVNYCQKDVATTVQVFLKMMGEVPIKSTNIEIKQ